MRYIVRYESPWYHVIKCEVYARHLSPIETVAKFTNQMDASRRAGELNKALVDLAREIPIPAKK